MLSIEDYLARDGLGLAELVRSGDAHPSEILETAIGRCEAVNGAINAVVIEMFDEARRTAAADLPEGPLSGVPFLLKDLGAYTAGFPTTYGCRFYAEHVPDHDSEVVRRYRAGGLVIFGKTASPEFGLTTSTESLLFGVTRNPWNLAVTSGGSSGGASAAVAAGILPIAHASDGGGSIRIPASCCGLFGMKPTRARVPMGPDAGEGWSGLSTVHAVSRSVRDSAALLDLSAGPMPGDPYAAPAPKRAYLDELSTPPRGLRIALTTEAFNGAATDPECRAAALSAAELCRELGHQVDEAAPVIDAERLGQATGTIVGANVRANLEERAEALGRAWTENDVEPITRAMVRNSEKVTASDYARAVRTVHAAGRVVASFFQDYDILLSPTMACLPKPLGVLSLATEEREAYLGHLMETIGYTQLMNVAGNPAMSVPLSWSRSGLPIGLQFAAPFGDEGTLYRLAGQLEEARPWRDRRPEIG